MQFLVKVSYYRNSGGSELVLEEPLPRKSPLDEIVYESLIQ
jgi:hypothetical protein